eukprot:CAMPEP_0173078696 /NCGR_PEP_ID=MMETSP1102-20130122/14379_1 /TAXON_ID=49646 /ORGANISM="Geminigera sp., Strain Caron Lab Isolate" /LENGTH=214 /DNA_ID=CAMNT_0013950231 /DNA_START=30 /DNA_END=674 /DNA_ORIENTATION=-
MRWSGMRVGEPKALGTVTNHKPQAGSHQLQYRVDPGVDQTTQTNMRWSGMSVGEPKALGLLATILLACLLVGNWVSAPAGPVAALQMPAGAMLVLEPGPVLGQLEPVEDLEEENAKTELRFRPYKGFQSLANRPCMKQCDQNMMVCMQAPTATPGTGACVQEQTTCYYTTCSEADWGRHTTCWTAARNNWNVCASASGSDPHCKSLFLNHVHLC